MTTAAWPASYCGTGRVYLSGWHVAADANTGGQMYPDQSLYTANSVPRVVKSINNALLRADQVAHGEGFDEMDWMLPSVADAEAGFGGSLNAFELMKAMIAAGAAGVHFEDQLSSADKCGHMGGKVLVPTREAIQKLVAARLAADVMGRADGPDRAHPMPTAHNLSPVIATLPMRASLRAKDS